MPSRLDALRARLEKATGPFGGRLPMVFTPTGDDLRGRVNDFLNHAPADLAALLVVVEAAQAVIAAHDTTRGNRDTALDDLRTALAAWTTE